MKKVSESDIYFSGPSCPVSVKERNFNDLFRGLKSWRLVWFIGVNDIVQRYKATFLGPLWMTISLSVFLTVLALVGGALFNLPLGDYLPYLCAGVVLWAFLSACINEGSQVFIAAPLEITTYSVPTSSFIYGFVVKQFILLFHNLIIFVVVASFFSTLDLSKFIYFVFGLFIYLMFAFGASTVLALVSVRYRDVPEVVMSILQVTFFVTPVMWKPELLVDRGRAYIIDYNPLYYILEVLRAPLLGNATSNKVLLVAFVISSCLSGLAIFLYMSYRHRVSFYR